MLEEECRAAGVSIFLNTKIQEVSRTTEFVVRTGARRNFARPRLVVATGGLSIPKIGATSFGYDLARQFGLKIREPWPGLVPLVLDAEDRSRYCDLAGVSAEVIASCDGTAVPRKNADHSSRTERPGNPADFVLLEKAAADRDRPGSRQRNHIDLPRSEDAANRRRSAIRTAKDSARIASPTAGSNCTRPLPGRTPPSPNSSSRPTPGPSRPPEPRATRKPKSLPAASTPTNFPPRRWRAAKSLACSSSAKSST